MSKAITAVGYGNLQVKYENIPNDIRSIGSNTYIRTLHIYRLGENANAKQNGEF